MAVKELRNKLYDVIGVAATAVKVHFDVSEMNRDNWRKMVQNWEENANSGNQLRPPWAVYEWQEPENGGGSSTDTSWTITVHWYYITSVNNTDGTGAKTADAYLSEIEDALEAVAVAIRAESGANCPWAMCHITKPSVSHSLNPNQGFLNFNAPFWAGRLTMTFVVGTYG